MNNILTTILQFTILITHHLPLCFAYAVNALDLTIQGEKF